MQTFPLMYHLNPHFFSKLFTLLTLHEVTENASLTFRENILARPIPIVISHIPVMQFLNKNISPAALALSLSQAGMPARAL